MENNRITDEKMLELAKDIDKWKQAHKEVIKVSLADDPFDGIFKVPMADHIKLANTQKDDLDKNKQLCLDCILYPSPEVFVKIIEERAGIIVPIALQLVNASGMNQEATAKKL